MLADVESVEICTDFMWMAFNYNATDTKRSLKFATGGVLRINQTICRIEISMIF